MTITLEQKTEGRSINLSHITEDELEVFGMEKLNTIKENGREFPVYGLGDERYMLRYCDDESYEIVNWWIVK